MRKMMISLVVLGVVISAQLASAQTSLQEMIEQKERETRSRPSAVMAIGEGEQGGSRQIRYEVDPRAMTVAARPAVVAIGQESSAGAFQTTGMGFYAGVGGLILSLEKCLGEDDPILIMTTDGQILEAGYVAGDDSTGVAVLDTDEDSVYLPLGDSEGLNMMTRLLVMQPSGSDPSQWGTALPSVQAIPCNVLPARDTGIAVDRPARVEVDLMLPDVFSGLPVLDPFGQVAGIYAGVALESAQQAASSQVPDASPQTDEEVFEDVPRDSPTEGAPTVLAIESGRRLIEKAPTTKKMRTLR